MLTSEHGVFFCFWGARSDGSALNLEIKRRCHNPCFIKLEQEHWIVLGRCLGILF